MQSPAESQLRFRFFDLDIGVSTDVPEVAAYCTALFGRFEEPDASPRIRLEIRSHPSGGWHVRDTVVDAVVGQREWLPGIATARILEIVGSEVEDHDLFHGAVLARASAGLVLIGESGYGKSSLTLALLKRGWSFLSDEVVALNRRDGSLSPFPKAIEAHPRTLRLVGIRRPAGEPRRRGKLLIDPEESFPGSSSSRCRPAAVVFLEARERRPGRVERGRIELTLHRRTAGLPEAIRQLEGVQGADWGTPRCEFPTLAIRYEPGRLATWRLDGFLARHGALILGTSAEEPPPASFEFDPELQPLPLSAAVGNLFSRFRGSRAFERKLAARGGDFGRWFVSLVERLDGCRCFRLTVGRLEKAVQLLEDVVPAAISA